MRVFNGHSDLITDLHYRRLAGEKEVFRHHYEGDFRAGQVYGSIFVLWTDENHQSDYLSWVKSMLKTIEAEYREQDDILLQIKTPKDIDRLKERDKIGFILGMEGLAQIGTEIEMLDRFYEENGLRHASLTWNEKNDLAAGPWESGGLTEAGKKAVQRMESLGILVDISHLNDEGAYDIFKQANGPIIASHSNARSLCNHPRNLPDKLIKEIAHSGGTIGLNAANEFIDEIVDKQDVDHLINHGKYIADLVGVDHLALGFDFMDFLPEEAQEKSKDGRPPTPADLLRESDVPNFLEKLREAGFSKDEVEQIAWGNFERVLRTVL